MGARSSSAARSSALPQFKALERVEIIERELAQIRKTLDQAAEVSYNITLYDPAGVRSSLGDC